MMTTRSFTCTLAVLAGMAGGTHAAVLLDESFDNYTTDAALIPQSGGGAGWAGGSFWSSNNAQSGTAANNLQVTAAQRAEILPTATNGGQAWRTLDTPLSDTAGQTYYISFDAQAYAANTRYFGLALFNNTTERTIVGHGTGQTNWGLNSVTDGVTSGTFSSGVDATTQGRLVLKVVFGGAGTPEQVSLWVNPDFNAAEGSAANNAVLVGDSALTSTTDWGDITQVRIGSGATSGANVFVPHWFDNLRIATDSPFAVPEPASLGLFALGCAFAVRRRR